MSDGPAIRTGQCAQNDDTLRRTRLTGVTLSFKLTVGFPACKVVVRKLHAVFSPSWSMHPGVGTRRYSFMWGRGGENQESGGIDAITMRDLQ